jgi:hypothetical protein
MPPRVAASAGKTCSANGRNYLYITSIGVREQLRRKGNRRCYHHIGMKPQKIGRVLGIGVRVAGRIAGERMAAGHRPATQTAGTAQARGKIAGRTAVGVVRGAEGFLRPFRRVGGILWLEVTGSLFLLPVVAFAPVLWRIRGGWAGGPDHRKFLVTAAVMAVFLYLSVSSFWRARRR